MLRALYLYLSRIAGEGAAKNEGCEGWGGAQTLAPLVFRKSSPNCLLAKQLPKYVHSGEKTVWSEDAVARTPFASRLAVGYDGKRL